MTAEPPLSLVIVTLVSLPVLFVFPTVIVETAKAEPALWANINASTILFSLKGVFVLRLFIIIELSKLMDRKFLI